MRRCDPTVEDCPPVCQQPQSIVEWTTFFNYLDISDQVRIEDDHVNSFNLIDTPQRDSASVEDDARIQQHPSDVDHTWSSSKISSGGTNLGRDIHWTVGNSRNRRNTLVKLNGSHHTWNDVEQVTLYCSNFLVNSTVALECGQYLVGNFIMKAIQICVEGINYLHKLLCLFMFNTLAFHFQMSAAIRTLPGLKSPWVFWRINVK